MNTPSFIFDMFEKELVRMQTELLSKVATKYNLNEAELVETFITGTGQPLALALVPNNSVTVVVQKKKNRTEKAIVADESRCVARIWNRGKGGQCTRHVCDHSPRYCSQHQTNRKHGDITNRVDAKLFPKNPTAIYK